MIVVSDTASLEAHLTTLRDHTRRVAFVPTMGNLHDGHLALVHQARGAADAVVVSIFVNPMQFAAHEDLDTYPRTLDDDLGALREAGVDLVLTPSADDIYPDSSARHTAIHVPRLGDALCGKDRPGHFDGVCTVIYKLFQLIRPDIAVFGEKDLQQLLIIKKMVTDLCLPIDIQSGQTQRAEDGLALSSRNQYLSASERTVAPLLWQTLQSCGAALTATPDGPPTSIIDPAREVLERAGFTVDYLELRELATLQLVDRMDQDCALFVAARLGETRLIDNIQLAASG
jgi:pantoate--beta-alanine ligase